MTILQIAILTVLAILIGQLRWGRELAMVAISALTVFWLQPAESVSTLQFWLPFATLGIATVSWLLTSQPEVRGLWQNWPALAVVAGIILLADLNRYFGFEAVYMTRTPTPPVVLLAFAGVAAVALGMAAWRRADRLWLIAMLLAIIAVFIVLKTPSLAKQADALLLTVVGGEGLQQSTGALSWLGYSYFAFRLMHTIRDRQMGRLPAVTLSEYLNYVVFFPSFTAGPIDRIERFTKDLCTVPHLSNDDWLQAGTRLFVGLFKKFVVADLLAVISINDALVNQVKSAPWLWVFLYAYALRIYLDFSGYTDIAIGMGRLMGIRLPENFASPYLKPNLTQFWNSWHMTLTQWVRAYVFNPVTRAMRSGRRAIPVWLVILAAQLLTMALIGLWHGIAAGFLLWGLWHGIGLFIHNRWSDFMRPRAPAWMQTIGGQRLANTLGVFLTFNFVAVGWLFFTLSTPAVAWLAILKLFRMA